MKAPAPFVAAADSSRTILAAAALAAAVASSAIAAEPSVTVDPAEVRPGSWTIVRVTGAKGPGVVRALGREIPLFAAEGGLRALVPVPLGTGAGRKPCQAVLRGGTLSFAVRVVARVEPPRQSLPTLEVTDKTANALKSGNVILGRAFRQTGPDALWSSPLRFPLQGRLTSGYGITRSYAGTAQWPHRGIDIAAPDGWPVVAAAAGRVLVSRRIDAYGNAVVLDHGQTVHTIYFHMSARQVVEGQRVEAGQVIGMVGATGIATGPHLHFGTYLGAVAVDPEEMMSRGLP
ncbi:MAG: M23 family metallopeptidase [Candidatus Coatesbacteria bacterium]